MQLLSPIFCKHPLSDEITYEDGEVICGHCGFVKGRLVTDSPNSESRTTLFLDVEIGGKPNNSLVANRYIHFNSVELSLISNLCQALGMPKFLSRDIWFWYQKIKLNLKMTKAKVIVLVFYQLCRYNKIPINENELLSKVKFYLDVKHVHTSLNVIAEANRFLNEKNELIVEKIGFTNLTSHNANFLLYSKIKSLHDEYPQQIITIVEKIAKEQLLTLSGTDEEIAKTAFKLAKKRCGLC
ncbi:MAG: hypothetical protein HRU07_05750 [Nitrosopumilus sp.]|nr:hypothetical protein [Nitrosopumilus sp.]NRA05650.1 hypothetical protein [Nitrosopumilus sp.]